MDSLTYLAVVMELRKTMVSSYIYFFLNKFTNKPY